MHGPSAPVRSSVPRVRHDRCHRAGTGRRDEARKPFCVRGRTEPDRPLAVALWRAKCSAGEAGSGDGRVGLHPPGWEPSDTFQTKTASRRESLESTSIRPNVGTRPIVLTPSGPARSTAIAEEPEPPLVIAR